MTQIIASKNVFKVYPGGKCALNGISFVVSEGESVALLGGNGSGKSTLLRILAGISHPSAGEVERVPSTRIGYSPERFPSDLRFTPYEYLMHMGRIGGQKPELVKGKIKELLGRYSLQNVEQVPIFTFSKGMRQKICIIQALLHSPNLLILDEPTSGLDRESRIETVTMLQTLRTETMAIIFSTHDGQLANELADRVLYLSDGALSPRQLEYATVNRYSMVLGWGEAEAPLWIKKVDGIVEIAWGDKEVMITVDENLRNQTLLDAIQHGLSVLKVERVRTDE